MASIGIDKSMPPDAEIYLLHAQLDHNYPRRVAEAQEIIRKALSEGRWGLSFSGGKDSLVMLHLVRQVHPTIPVAFANSGAEFPDTLALINRLSDDWDLDLTELEPAYSIWEIYAADAAYGSGEYTGQQIPATEYRRILIDDPMRQFRAENGLDGTFVGLRAQESRGRAANLYSRGAIYDTKDNGRIACPLWRWSARDVWAYIFTNRLPYNTVYDKFHPFLPSREEVRVGAYAGSTAVSHGRWAMLKHHYPELWCKLLERLPMAGQQT